MDYFFLNWVCPLYFALYLFTHWAAYRPFFRERYVNEIDVNPFLIGS